MSRNDPFGFDKPNITAVEYAEAVRQFAKKMLQFSKANGNFIDQEYYLGKIEAAKQIRDFLKKRVKERKRD